MADPDRASSAAGLVVALSIGAERLQPLVSVPRVTARAGRGVEGDRYFDHARRLSRDPHRACGITLIEMEALEALEREHGIAMTPAESRRTVAVRGIDLNALVGHEFRVGSARLRGLLLCEPCVHLERLSGKKVVRGLVHRGGLRAAIIEDGEIAVGDTLAVPDLAVRTKGGR